jgi:O-antigen ligase
VRKSQPTLEWIGFLLVAGCLGTVQFSIAAAQILFTLAVGVWLWLLVIDRAWPRLPAFELPLIVYAVLTFASAAFSDEPTRSFRDCKQLLMFLTVPLTMWFARGRRATQVVDVIIALGAVGAVYGIIQYAMLGYEGLGHRPRGTLSIYMTFSGVLMLVTCAAAARLVFFSQQRIWPAIAVPALLVALVATYARNAWIGVMAAITYLLGARRPKWLWVVPVLILIFFLVAPSDLTRRATSMFDRNDPTVRDRFVMLAIGTEMIRDHPWFGVGPERVQAKYPEYRQRHPDAVNPVNPHLHNVPMQIAAERGLPALAAWLWFVIIAGRDLMRQVHRGPAKAVAGAGAAALIAMLTAGMFEYNFGDTEFLILFLGLITLPFAAATAESTVPVAAAIQPAPTPAR